ncbi:MAG: hypothetical protein KDI67_13625, partial [Gammaproteobacteria bacterium]|nr:hypothetical protein [Gammaproteobacteria bacterium]
AGIPLDARTVSGARLGRAIRRHVMLTLDHETAVDFLNYEAIAGTAIELLKDNRERALSIGIHGNWGAGAGEASQAEEAWQSQRRSGRRGG